MHEAARDGDTLLLTAGHLIRHRLELFADLEIKGQAVHRRDRHFHAEFVAQLRPPAIGGIEKQFAGQPLTRFKFHRDDLIAADLEIDDAILEVCDAKAHDLAVRSARRGDRRPLRDHPGCFWIFF